MCEIGNYALISDFLSNTIDDARGRSPEIGNYALISDFLSNTIDDARGRSPRTKILRGLARATRVPLSHKIGAYGQA